MTRPPNILWIVATQWRAQALGSAGDPNLLWTPAGTQGPGLRTPVAGDADETAVPPARKLAAAGAPTGSPADTRDGTPAGSPARSRTPCLDALARDPRTLNFAQAVTPHPFGPFARAAMLTGVPSPENGVRDYFDPLPPDARTIAHELRERHGYATAFFGKWHLARRDPSAPLVGDAHARAIVPPDARGGFDFWEGFESGFLLNDLWLHGTRLPEPRQFHGYQSDILCERAAEYLRAREKNAAATGAAAPQFCIVSLEAPHPPYAAPTPENFGVRDFSPAFDSGIHPAAKTKKEAGGGTINCPVKSGTEVPHSKKDRDPASIILRANVPLGGAVEAQARRELAGYYAHIEATDAAIGNLIARVRAHAPDTLIVFTSVHGDMHGSHGLFRKGWPHEESVRVPLLLNAPALEAETAQTSQDAVSLLDLPAMTTAFVTRAASLQNRAPRTHAHISMPSVVRLPHQCDRAWRGIRTPARKLILNEDGARTPWLFFDLENDPLELRNLAGDPSRKQEIETLRQKVAQTFLSVP